MSASFFDRHPFVAKSWSIARQALRQWREDGATGLAAALSFYTVVALAPLITTTLSVVSLFYGPAALRGELVAQVSNYVGAAGADVVQDIIANARSRGSGLSATLSVVMLLVGASAVFAQLQSALNKIWNVAPKPERPWSYQIKDRLLSAALVIGIGLLFLGFTAAGALLSGLGHVLARIDSPQMAFVWQATNFLLGIAVFTVVFAALFKLLPDAIILWREVWVGAVVTSLLFNAGRLAIGFYLGRTAPGSAYGATGSLVVVLIWIYYSASILFLGAEFTQVYARYLGRAIRPASYAYRTSTVALPVDEEGNPILHHQARADVKARVECPPDTEGHSPLPARQEGS